jgi:PPM family protein phosphatase
LTEPSSPPPQRFSNGHISLEAVGRTDVGRRRPHNEDTLGLLPAEYQPLAAERGYLFAVADGMGGAEKGEVASRLAVEALFATYYDDSEPDLPPEAALRAAFAAANGTVYGEGLNLDFGMMGTTLVAALVANDRLIVGHVGDSRAYLIRDGALRRLTDDHSLVEEQMRAGLLTPDQARTSPQRNIITRAIGHQVDVEDDQRVESPLQPGDLVLLCSDGLHGMLEDEELLAIAQQADLAGAAAALIAAANARGGHDNITSLLVRVLAVGTNTFVPKPTAVYTRPFQRAELPTQPGRRPPPAGLRRRGALLAAGLAGVVAVGTGLVLVTGLLGSGSDRGRTSQPTPFTGMRVSGRVLLPAGQVVTPLGLLVAVEGPGAQRLSALVGNDASYRLDLPPDAPEGTYTLAVRPEQISAGDAPQNGSGARRIATYPPRTVALTRGSDVVVDLGYEIVEENRPPVPTAAAATPTAPANAVP